MVLKTLIYSLTIFSLQVMFAGCATIENTEINKDINEILLSERIAKGSLYGGGEEGIEEGLIIAKNDEDWMRLKSRMDSVNPVSGNFRKVNFREEMILAYFDKVRPSGAYAVKITEVVEHKNSVEIFVELQVSELPAISVLTQPYHIVAVPQTEKPITIITKEVIE